MSIVLGPYGEGYCKVCRFIEPLGPDGLLEEHFRGRAMDPQGGGARCPGGFSRPQKKVPFSSRLASFRARVTKKRCEYCEQRIGVVDFSDGKIHFSAHRPRASRDIQMPSGNCPGSFQPVC